VLVWIGGGNAGQAPQWNPQPPVVWTAWLADGWAFLRDWGLTLWRLTRTTLVLVGGTPLLWGLVLGLFWPRAACIVASSVLGAAAVVSGAGLLVWAYRPDWAQEWALRFHLPLAAGAVLAAVGLSLQARWQARKDRQAKAEELDKGKAREKGEPASGASGREDR
jgi:Na+/proline symporter